jgi:hypothetical protein
MEMLLQDQFQPFLLSAAKNDWQMDINQRHKMQVLVLAWHNVH